MQASEIRRRFLDYFQARGHRLLPSSPLVPGDDPTLLFTNAGMVQFKGVFLGEEALPFNRAVTAQKCVRAGGKHNDLEQVGETARHHTFFEMLGNFSFGDYFKRDAVHFAWEFLTGELELDPERLYITVHHTDDEAYALWQEVAGVPETRIFRLGDRDNFWQMADTGPCGPCSELHYDLRPEGERGIPSTEEFERLGEEGVFIELWNLVFMQYDRDAQGVLHPLPAPSIDTGAGLERLAAVIQGADSNYHTDLFHPLLARVERVIGRAYEPLGSEGVSFRVLADHARAVAFLLADRVFPSNEGRGYVVRRILRRGVRHAYLLGRREPTLVEVVEAVVEAMGGDYPELVERRSQILKTTRSEEERFLATIEGGMTRFEELAEGEGEGGVISGEEAFRLYDTFGFPLDLTELMARERGCRVDVEGFEQALEAQRARSRAARVASGGEVDELEGKDGWVNLTPELHQRWIGYSETAADTRVLAFWQEGERAGVILEENPFYAEAGGQVSDRGQVEGEGWRVQVDTVRKAEGRNLLLGRMEGEFPTAEKPFPARAEVDANFRRDTERNHTSTHLLHAALREVLGDHVAQRGSLVTPDRLRFDFSHPQPMTPEEIEAVESRVNRAIWSHAPVRWEVVTKDEALSRGAMALFGEKYGDEVRVVEIPGVSLELCGGTHLAHTSEAGLFRILKEGGVAAGVRRIEALTGHGAFASLKRSESELAELSHLLRSPRENLLRRTEQLLSEKAELEALLDELRRAGGGGATTVLDEPLPGVGENGRGRYLGVRMKVRDADDARAFGDAFRENTPSGVAVVAAELQDDKGAFFAVVTDDLISRGVRAGDLVKELAGICGGRGGGRPHMAQGGIEDPTRVDEAMAAGHTRVLSILGEGR